MKRILKTLLILLVSLFFLVQPFFCFAEKGSSDASENPLIDLTIKPFAQSDVTVSVIELPDNPEDSRYYFSFRPIVTAPSRCFSPMSF